VLDRVFARAAAMLEATPGVRYADRVEQLARDAARYLEGEPAQLRCPPDAAPAVRKAVRGLPDLSVTPGVMSAGVTGASMDGRVLVDNSLPALLSRQRADLAIALAARIEAS